MIYFRLIIEDIPFSPTDCIPLKEISKTISVAINLSVTRNVTSWTRCLVGWGLYIEMSYITEYLYFYLHCYAYIS